MNITKETIIDELFEKHFILVDELIEYDADGNASVIKNMCRVIRPNGDSLIFNVSPYIHPEFIVDMAKTWIACDCPENKDELGIPQKWDADSLHVLVTS